MYDPVTKLPTSPTTERSSETEVIRARDVLRFLRAAAPMIIVGAVLTGALALAYAATTTPTYTAWAKVLIDPGAGDTLIVEEGTSGNTGFEIARVDSEAELIKSERISLAVIEKLKLLEDSEFQPEGAGLIGRIIDLIQAPIASSPVDEPSRRNAALQYASAVFDSRLNVRRIGQSFVLEINYRSSDPEKSALIANAVTEAYLDQDIQAKRDQARRGGEWLEQRLAELRTQAFDAMGAVERFKAVGGAGPVGESQVKLAELESISSTYRRMYESYLQRLTETDQRISYPVADARVVASAAVPLAPSHPKSRLIVLFGIVLGACIGFGIALIRRSFDRRLRHPSQLTHELGLECLGTIGRIDLHNGHMDAPLEKRPRRFTSDLRVVKNAINSATLGRKSRCIGISSEGPGDGKTTVASGLALLYAVSGARTLLIDACVDSPTISRHFAGDPDSGLMQVLDDPACLPNSVVAHGTSSNLHFLGIGPSNGRATPGDRIGSELLDFRVDDLRDRYDIILFDLPPIATSPDALAIAPFLDGVVVVARWGQTSLDALGEATAALISSHARILGVVINLVEHRRPFALPRIRRSSTAAVPQGAHHG